MSETDAMRRRFLGAAVSFLILVPLSVVFADRGVSSWSHDTWHGIHAFIWLTWIAEPVLPLAGLGLAGLGVAALAGWRPGPAGRAILACCLSALIAYALKDELKYLFGRLWPETFVENNPSWIGTGAYGFAPLHGGRGWMSFPSGHTTMIASPMPALWRALPRLRFLWVALPVLVAIGLIGADYHFLSDVLAGAYLGTVCGIGAEAIIDRRPA